MAVELFTSENVRQYKLNHYSGRDGGQAGEPGQLRRQEGGHCQAVRQLSGSLSCKHVILNLN